jgi:hypothetical protein
VEIGIGGDLDFWRRSGGELVRDAFQKGNAKRRAAAAFRAAQI